MTRRGAVSASSIRGAVSGSSITCMRAAACAILATLGGGLEGVDELASEAISLKTPRTW